jgi:hypothetical protein
MIDLPNQNTKHDKDPDEQEMLARELGEDLIEVFAEFARGEREFAEVTFQTYETLQDLWTIASGAYELEFESDDDSDDDLPNDGDIHGHYDERTATEQQEELAQEPSA